MAPDATDIAIRDASDITRADPEQASAALAHVLGSGDLSKLTNTERVHHYLNLCSSLALNPLSRPFQWIEFKETENSPPVLTLYLKPSGAAQILRNNQVSTHFTRKAIVGELFVVEVEGKAPNGRTGHATKYVALVGKYGKLTGRYLANAFMSAETGALRRLALSMFGLSTGPDADEVYSLRDAVVDGEGRILAAPTDTQRALADDPRLARVLKEPTYETTAAAAPSPYGGAASQAPTLDELTPPEGPYQPPARFHCDKQRWLGVWHMLVRGTFLADDDARHDFVGWYTSPWPENRQTSSLSTFLDRATDRQAEALINRARETLADRASFAPVATDDAAPTEYDAPVSVTIDERDAVEYPDRPLDGVEYSTAALRAFYAAWADTLRHRDTGFRPITDNALMRSTKEQLLHEIRSLIGQVESVDSFLAMADDEGADIDAESMPTTDSELPF